MDKKEVLASIKDQKSTLDKFGVRSIALFGSFAREEGKDTSDIDMLVEFKHPVGLFEFAGLKLYLEKVLGRKVDLVTPEALREEMRENILREAFRVI
jgi:predicted nucleotidyltransferase